MKSTPLLLNKVPVANTAMLIRKPAADVFEAVVNPDLTTQFWFTRSSGRLVAGKRVRWDWKPHGVTVSVLPHIVQSPSRVLLDWTADGTTTQVDWAFNPHPNGTFLTVANSGYSGEGDEVVKKALDSTQGFALMLAGMKAFLEHNLLLNLVADRYPT